MRLRGITWTASSGATNASLRITPPCLRTTLRRMAPQALPAVMLSMCKRKRFGAAGFRSILNSINRTSRLLRTQLQMARRQMKTSSSTSSINWKPSSFSSRSKIPAPKKIGRGSGSSGAATPWWPAPKVTSSSSSIISALITTTLRRSAPAIRWKSWTQAWRRRKGNSIWSSI